MNAWNDGHTVGNQMFSNHSIELLVPGRRTTVETELAQLARCRGAMPVAEFALHPDRMRMAPRTVTSVALLASDPLTEEGALARFSNYRELDVRGWSAGREVAVLLVLATTITAALLSKIEDVQRDASGNPPKLVVVADEFSAEQVFRMIDLELTGLLYRGQSTFDSIVETILLSAEGRLRLPERVQRHLVGRVRSIGVAQPGAGDTACLAERAVEVLRLLSDGLSTCEVATRLNYSERTIKNIVHDVVTRLKLRNRTHAIAYAVRAGII